MIRKTEKALIVKGGFLRLLLIFSAMTVIFVLGAFSASAVSAAQQGIINYTDKSVSVEVTRMTYDSLMNTNRKTAQSLDRNGLPMNEKFRTLVLSDDEIVATANKIAKSAKVYKTVLSDGTVTYYIAVDLRNDVSVYLHNPFVLREVARILNERTQTLSAREKGKLYLMDYTHLVGELKSHFTGYNFSKKLGGEKSNGLIGQIYDSCSIADLNVDEDRFPVMIRWLGVVVG